MTILGQRKMSLLNQIDGKIEAEGEFSLTDRFWKESHEIYRQALEEAVQPLIEALKEPEPLDWYDIRDYDLSEERKDFRINDFPTEGDIVFVISTTGTASVKFDSPNADPFDLSLAAFKKIKHRYSELYLTNEAQSGETLKILFGRGDWDFVEKIPEMDIQGIIRNDYLEQITDPLKIGQIIKDSHIIPHADIACEKILVSETTRLDQWRSTEDYTYIAPGMMLLYATKKLSDWRHPSAMTYIHGGQIYTESIEAEKLSISDLVEIANKMILAEGRVVIDKDAFGPNLPGIIINDGTYNRVEAGELAEDIYGMTIRDASGVLWAKLGELQGVWQKVYDHYVLADTTEITVSGLDGDNDQAYFILWVNKSPAGMPAAIELDYMEYANDAAIQAAWVTSDSLVLQCHSESVIKEEGSYSMKGIAKQSPSTESLTRTVDPTIDLSDASPIKFDIRSSRTGPNIKVGIRDSGGAVTEITPDIILANTWQTVEWDISGVANVDKDAIDRIIITILGSAEETKTWTTKADWDSGSLDDLYCPKDLEQLEIAYDKLSGTGTYIFDAGKIVQWKSLSHTKENAKTIWRDDFRADSRSRYTLHNFPPWRTGAGASPGYDAANHRLTIDTGGFKGTTLEIPGSSIKNAIASMEVYIYGYYETVASSGIWLRRVNNTNCYVTVFQSTAASEVLSSAIVRFINGDATELKTAGRFPKNTWRTLVFRINGNYLNAYTNEFSMTAYDGTFTAAKPVLLGCWQTKGYVRNILLEHYTLPSPVNNSVTFQFATSDDGTSWSAWTGNITSCADSRYIKVKVSMSRTNFLSSAMPVLKDMKVTYAAPTNMFYIDNMRVPVGVQALSELRLNNDSGDNYGTIYSGTDGTNFLCGKLDPTSKWIVGDANGPGQTCQAFLIIDAKSGKLRTCNVQSASRIVGTDIKRSWNYSHVWNNIDDNITSIKFMGGVEGGIGAGSHLLIYRMKKY